MSFNFRFMKNSLERVCVPNAAFICHLQQRCACVSCTPCPTKSCFRKKPHVASNESSPLADMALEPPRKWWKGKEKIPSQNCCLEWVSPKPSPCSPNPGPIIQELVPGQSSTGCHLVVITRTTGRGTQSHGSVLLGGYLLIFSPYLTEKKNSKVQGEPQNCRV